MRHIALDTETTGLDRGRNHDRIIEIGAVEIMRENAASFHEYIDPQKTIDPGAFKVHGISNESLQGKPKFAEVMDKFVAFIKGAVLIIHNAEFDLAFLNHELALAAQQRNQPPLKVEDLAAKVEDTLIIAREKFPNQQHNLDALLQKFNIDASSRAQGHGALIDAVLLGKVYESMCVTQSTLELNKENTPAAVQDVPPPQDVAGQDVPASTDPLKVVKPTAEELAADKAIREQLGFD